MLNHFKPYNREELLEKINAIEIFKIQDLDKPMGEQITVVTKYFGRVINVTPVSKRYEIFDIRNFLKEKISNIESNFNVTHYKFVMRSGIQELVLLSDVVDINGNNYYKSFFILNSSNKSRRLNMNMGLYRHDGVYFISGITNMQICKKHLTGLTKAAEEVAMNIDGETFNEQVESIKSLIGEKVLLSNVREIIVDKDQQINHRKFNSFKAYLVDFYPNLTKDQIDLLKTPSEKITINSDNDFQLDAYQVFNLYMTIFRNQDSYIVRKETERIIKITQCFIRNRKLENLLMELV